MGKEEREQSSEDLSLQRQKPCSYIKISDWFKKKKLPVACSGSIG